jgi:integrase
MGTPSVTYQITDTLKTIFTPGVSRHELKKRGLADKRIVGIRTMQDYVKASVRFAKWCKENHGIRYVREITPAMAEQYIGEMCNKELSGGYIGKVKSALRKLDIAMRVKGYRSRDAVPLLEPGGGWHSDRRPEEAYTPRQAIRLIECIRHHAKDKQTADVVRLQWIAGLRVKEAVMIREQDIDPDTCTLFPKKGTKGGYHRTIQVDPEHRSFLKVLKTRADRRRDGHVFKDRGHRGEGLKRRTGTAVRDACERLGMECFGTHGFRRGWAQEQYRELREQGSDDREARRSTAKGLGHKRLDVTYSYIPR